LCHRLSSGHRGWREHSDACFTTGRGSVFGAKPTPSIKIAPNSQMFDRMPGDMDLNASRIVNGTATIS
jgi:altronate hydrolase